MIDWCAQPDAAWDEDVSLLTGSLFLSARWIRVVARGYGRPVACARIWEGGPKGMAAGVVLGPPGFRIWFSLVPFGGIYGPAATDAAAWDHLLADLRRRGCVQAQWVPEQATVPPVRAHGIESIGHRRPLPATAAALWDSFESRRRTDVRRAERHGVRVEERSDAEGARVLHSLYRGVMAEHRARRRYPEDLFVAIAEGLEPHDREILIATAGGRPAGGALILYSEACAYLFMPATARALRHLHVGDAVTARALGGAVARGMHVFDFMGSPPGATSLVRWKEKWGGEPRRLVRYVAALARWRSALVDLGLAARGGRVRRRATGRPPDPRT